MSETPLLLDRAALQRLIPHAGAMCLLDGVLTFDEERIVAIARSHRQSEHPLHRDGAVAALHLCEYGAQAMAVHGGLLAARNGSRAAPGLLVSLRAVSLLVDRIDTLPGDLEVTAQRLLGALDSWQYAFAVRHAGELLAEGRAAVVLCAQQTFDPPGGSS